MLTNFIPKSVTEWTYIALIAVLLVTLFIFYKGVMKCKTIIESYNNELRNYKKFYNYADDFIAFAQSFYPSIMSDYASESGISEAEQNFIIQGVNSDNE